jgi:hypothetical protein
VLQRRSSAATDMRGWNSIRLKALRRAPLSETVRRPFA